MDIIGAILARNSANELKASGGAGYTTPQIASFKTDMLADLTPDVTLLDVNLKWISPITPTKDEFLSGVLKVGTGNEVWGEDKITSDDLGTIVHTEVSGAYAVVMTKLAGLVFVVSTVLENEIGTLPKTGMYVGCARPSGIREGATYTLEFPETIHPIDPKYIPGAVLPVVEIATDIGGTLTELNDFESARLDEVSALVSPINVVLSPAEGAIVSAPCFLLKSEEGILFKSMISHDVSVNLVKQGGKWMGLYGSM